MRKSMKLLVETNEDLIEEVKALRVSQLVASQVTNKFVNSFTSDNSETDLASQIEECEKSYELLEYY